MMMKCEELTRLSSESMERALGLRERAAMRLHLMMCDGCSNFVKQMGSLRSMCRSFVAGQTPDIDASDQDR